MNINNPYNCDCKCRDGKTKNISNKNIFHSCDSDFNDLFIFTEKGKNGMSENEHQDAGDKCKDSSEKKRPAKAFLTPFLISRAIFCAVKVVQA